MPTALITGASSGLGVDYARLFAADKHDLVLVARRRDRLEALAVELSAAYGVRVEVLAVDLGEADATKKIVAELARLGLEVHYLVNNAGFGASGLFADSELGRDLEMIRVNVSALTELTHALVPGMVKRGRGRVLNVASTAAFQPGPYMAVYYATKAYVLSFTEAIAHELRGTGVTATASCPGPTLTEFAQVAGNDKSRLFTMTAMRSDVVARQAYRAMHAGRVVVVHGFFNAIGAFFVRLSPRALVRAAVSRLNATTAGVGQPRLKS